MKTVGLIMEGKTDWAFFKPFINAIVGDEVDFKELMPFIDNTGRHPPSECGWEGVEKTCNQYSNGLALLMDGVSPRLDALVIHLDADVVCSPNFIRRYGNLEKPCPPVIDTCNNIRDQIKEWLKYDSNQDVCRRIIIVVPSKATEAWIGLLKSSEINECTVKPENILIGKGIITGKNSKEYFKLSDNLFKENVENSEQPSLFPNNIVVLSQKSEEAKIFVTSIRDVLLYK
jgi:hypothetical protein